MEKQQAENTFMIPGAPIDPFGRDDHTIMNARIMPSQFSYPSMPVNLALLRDVHSSDITSNP